MLGDDIYSVCYFSLLFSTLHISGFQLHLYVYLEEQQNNKILTEAQTIKTITM